MVCKEHEPYPTNTLLQPKPGCWSAGIQDIVVACRQRSTYRLCQRSPRDGTWQAVHFNQD